MTSHVEQSPSAGPDRSSRARLQLGDIAAPGAALGAVGVALTAAFATLCCAGPAVVAVLGVSGAVAAASLEPYRPYFLGLSFVLLVFAFWRSYSRPKELCEDASCSTKRPRGTRVVLWGALLVTVVSVALPYLGLY